MAAEASFNVKCHIHFWVWTFHVAFQGVDQNSFDGSRCTFECEMSSGCELLWCGFSGGCSELYGCRMAADALLSLNLNSLSAFLGSSSNSRCAFEFARLNFVPMVVKLDVVLEKGIHGWNSLDSSRYAFECKLWLLVRIPWMQQQQMRFWVWTLTFGRNSLDAAAAAAAADALLSVNFDFW